jgi:hypothetical protein
MRNSSGWGILSFFAVIIVIFALSAAQMGCAASVSEIPVQATPTQVVPPADMWVELQEKEVVQTKGPSYAFPRNTLFACYYGKTGDAVCRSEKPGKLNIR